jgi:hypothetical protein
VPTIGAATALTYSTASVTFTAPGAYAATTYTATSSPGGLTGTSATSPITVSGLSEQTAYTFTVTATNATGTSRPSAASSSITTPVAFTPESGYDSLASITLSASATSIVFAGIPSGYKHLQIRAMHRATTGAGDGTVYMQFNGDSASNYSWHRLYGYGSSAGADASTSTTSIAAGQSMGATPSLQGFSAMISDILDYTNTSKYKTVRSLSGTDLNGDASGAVFYNSGSWRSTSAVTSITITTNETAFATYSSFALYGVK